MIVKHFNQGWCNIGQAHLEEEVLKIYLREYYENDEKVVLVNNTWILTWFDNGVYRGENTLFRDSITDWLDANEYDRVFIYNLVDPLNHDSIDQLAKNVHRIGYSKTPHWIDFQALAIDRFFRKDPVGSSNISVPFMCLNGKPHPHRVTFVKELVARGLHTRGLVSFGGNDEIPQMTIPETYTKIEGVNADPYDALTFGDMHNWNRHFLNVITETLWDVENQQMWTEKFFKPLLGKRPFLFYTDHGATNMLAEHRFESFVDDFADISDLDLTDPHNLSNFLVALTAQKDNYYKEKYKQLAPKIEYNHNRFYEHVAEQWKKVTDGIAL